MKIKSDNNMCWQEYKILGTKLLLMKELPLWMTIWIFTYAMTQQFCS